MRWLTAALIAIGMMGACATRSGSRTGVNAGGLAMGAGALTVLVSGVVYFFAGKPACGTGPTPLEDGACDPDRETQRASTVSALVGGSLFVGGVITAVVFANADSGDADDDEERARARSAAAWQRAQQLRIERDRNRDDAWT